MNVLIAGGTGLLGSALVAQLERDGHDVCVLSRRPRAPKQIAWNPDGTAGTTTAAVDGADVVVNLSGESIASGRWTTGRKAAILNSRINATRTLVAAMGAASHTPSIFISGSAVGYYGPHGDEPLTEDSAAGSDFLAGVCRQWEQEAQPARQRARVVLVRTGVVLDRTGGALPQIARPFRFFAGGPVGSGDQYYSWIHIADWVAMVIWAMKTGDVSGALNVTAPQPVTNREFAKKVGAVLGRPAILPTPALPLRILLGEMADALLLTGQRVLPSRAQQGGFQFQYPTLEPALAATLG